MRMGRTALLAAVLAGCSGSTVDAPDAASRSSESSIESETLRVARELARPDRSIAEVLRGRIALRSEGAGLGITPLVEGDLALHVAAHADQPTHIGTDEAYGLSLTIEGGAPVAVDNDHGSAIHRDVFPGTDAIWATTESRAELLLLLRDERAPTHFRVHLARGSGLVRVEPDRDGYSFRDARGNARLHIPAPVALDAHGVRRAARMHLDRAHDGGETLEIALDDTGLARPILLDPAVLQARWTLVGDRVGRTRGALSWDPVRKKLIGFGGYQGAGYNEPGGAAVQLFAVTFPARSFDDLATGPMGFTSAMVGDSAPYADYAFFSAFDAARGKLVAVGSTQYDCSGSGYCTSVYKTQVFEWDSATNVWSQRCTDAACAASAPPSSQRHLQVVHDASRNRTLVCDRSARTCWTWNGATGVWASIASFPAPAMGEGYYDPQYGAVTFLGSDGTYAWNGNNWMKRTTSTVSALGATFDTIRKRAIAVVGNGLNTDTFEWDGTTTWALVATATTSSPFAKERIAMGFDPVNGRALAWGGGVGQVGYYSFDFISELFEYQAFGNACAGAVDCLGGSCRDGFCCDAQCDPCRRCDGPGSGGVCAVFAGVASGTEHDVCTGTSACNPSGACKKKNGQTCGAGTDCLSGACVDGFCCSTACNQACQVCNATPGTCTAAPKGSSGRTGCGAGTCNGTSTTCSTICATDADCSAIGYCAGTTCTAGLAKGASCARDRQCLSGSCRDGICCDTGCNGPCEACTTAKGASANGTCTALPATTKPLACGGYACSGTSGACAASCTTDDQCTAGYYCDGTFCQKARAQGEGCARTAQCGTGLACADGVCCNSACDGACQACSAANKQSGDASGTCGAARIGSDPGERCPSEDPSTCGKSGVCGAGGTCALWPKGRACGGVSCESGTAKGRTCDGLGACITDAAGTACAPGTCTAASGCTFTCESDGECDAAGFCDAGTCKARSSDGRTCTADPQCASGHCVDGVCCASACTGVCEACNGVGTEGTCTAAAGPPREGHGSCPAASSDDACSAAACDGTTRDACKAFAGPEVQCRAASCVDALETLAGRCDGSGKCPAASSRGCAPFACTGTRCAESCTADDACTKGNRCDTATGKCVSNGTCDGDHSVVGADGSKTDCAPYRCDDAGCKATCASSDDCASPAICDGARCVLAAAQEDAGGCSTSGRPSRETWILAGLVAVLATTRRASARKGAR